MSAKVDWAASTIVLLLVSTAGCEPDWQAATQPATGTVSINGQPPEGLIVHLISADEPVDVRRSRPFGFVDAAGKFSLRTYSTGEEGDGAPVGTYKVVLKWPVDRHVFGSPDQLRGRYDTEAESPMTITIAEGQTELTPIVLDGVKVVRPQQTTVRSAKQSPFSE